MHLETPARPLSTCSRRAVDADVALYCSTLDWQRALLYRAGRHVPDAAAEVAASVWGNIVAGVTDPRELYIAASRVLSREYRRQRRRHHRFVLTEPGQLSASVGDELDRVDAAVDAQRVLAALMVPLAAQRWVVKRVTGDGPPLMQAEQRAGRRWANRAMVTLRPGGAFDAA